MLQWKTPLEKRSELLLNDYGIDESKKRIKNIVIKKKIIIFKIFSEKCLTILQKYPSIPKIRKCIKKEGKP